MRRIPKTRVAIRIRSRAATKLVDEQIVLAREDVVQEAETDRPVVGEGGGFLPGPLRLDRITRRERRQIPLLVTLGVVTRKFDHEQLRRVGGIALHATGRAIAVA